MPAVSESQHILDLLGVGALWALTQAPIPNPLRLRQALRRGLNRQLAQ